MIAPLRQVVDRRRSGEHDAGGDHRALLDRPRLRRSPVFPPTSTSSSMMTGMRADGLDDAADLRGGAEVHALADLRARSDERVRIDERAFADVRADVDVHRRHADDACDRRTRPRESSIRPARCGRRRRRPASSAASCPCRRTAIGRGRPTRRRCRRTGSRAECPASPRR